MKNNSLIFILCFLAFSACTVNKLNWSTTLKRKQKNDKIIPRYFIDFSFRNRTNLEKSGILSSFTNSDTLFLIEKIDNQFAKTGESYIWDNNRDKVVAYFDTLNQEAKKIDKNKLLNAYTLRHRSIDYADIDTGLKNKVENFDTISIEKNQILDGFVIIISRIVKSKQIEYYYFYE